MGGGSVEAHLDDGPPISLSPDQEVVSTGCDEDAACAIAPPQKPYRVLHISDVHFGSHFDASVWAYLKALVRREKPDLIVCTGDIVDHGSLFMLAAAKLELEALKNEAGEETLLRCVRGNHDCGPFGNINVPPFSSNFAAIFGPNAMEVPSTMTPYVRYRNRLLPFRLIQRTALTCWLYAKKWVVALRRWHEGKSLFALPAMREDDPEKLVLIQLDSNHTQWLASGSIDPAAVTGIKSRLLNLRTEEGGRSFAPRIALMHHHALPIPEASIKEGLTSFEPFLVLRNSGFVLRELSRCDVDLILHGHKHYSAFTRLGYSVDHAAEGEIAVLAAGSCGVTHAESGRNSVNIIDILETGRMSYTAIYFGGGGGAPVNELFRHKRDVHGLEMHKARVHRRAAERQGQWVERLRHQVFIDIGGVAAVRHEVDGHAFDRSHSTDIIPVYIDVSMGRVAHNTLRLLDKYKLAAHHLVNHPTKPETSIRCGINLGQRLATSPPSDYGFRYVCFNSYAVTTWETEAVCARDERIGRHVGRSRGLEFTSCIIRVPMRQLVMRLTLPPHLVFGEPKVRVMRWRSYPNIELDEFKHFCPEAQGTWERDSDLTEHEASKLARKSSNEWELRVAYPLVGHRYDIVWRVRNEEREELPLQELSSRRGRTMAYRRLLLNGPPTLLSHVSSKLKLLRNFATKHFAGSVLQDEEFEIAVFVYDADRQALRQLELGDLNASPGQQPELEVPIGEGIVGAAFKTSDFVMYVDPKVSGSSDDAAYLYQSDDTWGESKWKFVAAFPIFALANALDTINEVPFYTWGPQTTVGVITFASTAPDSGLLKLMEESSNGSKPRAEGSGLDEKNAPQREPEPFATPETPDDLAKQGPRPNSASRRPSATLVWANAHTALLSGIAPPST